MSVERPISFRGTHGAGVYGREIPRGHRCGRCNNGTGITNPNCPNAPKDVLVEEIQEAARD